MEHIRHAARWQPASDGWCLDVCLCVYFLLCVPLSQWHLLLMMAGRSPGRPGGADYNQRSSDTTENHHSLMITWLPSGNPTQVIAAQNFLAVEMESEPSGWVKYDNLLIDGHIWALEEVFMTSAASCGGILGEKVNELVSVCLLCCSLPWINGIKSCLQWINPIDATNPRRLWQNIKFK